MESEGFKRKLTVILSADVVGYSHLMGEDYDATVHTLTGQREMMSTLINRHQGRVVDSPGAMGTECFDQLYEDFPKADEKRVAKIVTNSDEIAEYIGAKPEVLITTIEQYNTYCDNGYDYGFLKPKKYLLPLRAPPFYAVLGRQGFDSTFGGI